MFRHDFVVRVSMIVMSQEEELRLDGLKAAVVASLPISCRQSAAEQSNFLLIQTSLKKFFLERTRPYHSNQ